MRRGLKWGILGVLGVALVGVGIVGFYSVRVAREVEQFERVAYVPLPTTVPPTATTAPTVAVAAARASVPPPPAPTVVPPPSTGRIISDGIKAGVNGSDGREPVWQGKRYVRILLLGLDRRDETEITRSDTMIIATLDLWEGVASLLSIPRDLVVNIPGNGEDRINAAYAFGQLAHPDDPAAGPALAVATVAKAFDVTIDHYIQVDFKGFRGVVDAVGGVDIDIAETIDDPDYPTDDYGYKHIHFDPGCYHLDGVRALEYARSRHDSDDNKRRDRQMQVMQAALDQTSDMNAARRLPEIVKALGSTVQTSIPWEGQLSLARMSRKVNAAGVARYSIQPPLVRGVITYGGASVYIGDWPRIRELAKEATNPKPPAAPATPEQQTPAPGAGAKKEETAANDLASSAAPARCRPR